MTTFRPIPLKPISLVIGTDYIAEQQVLQERVNKDIVRVNSFLVSDSKKRLKVFTVDSPQFPGDPWQILMLLGPMWTRPWDS